jgi:hypothetical protein
MKNGNQSQCAEHPGKKANERPEKMSHSSGETIDTVPD